MSASNSPRISRFVRQIWVSSTGERRKILDVPLHDYENILFRFRPRSKGSQYIIGVFVDEKQEDMFKVDSSSAKMRGGAVYSFAIPDSLKEDGVHKLLFKIATSDDVDPIEKAVTNWPHEDDVFFLDVRDGICSSLLSVND